MKPNNVRPVPGFGGEEAEHDDQAQDAADIADGPAGARQPADPLRRHQRRHHRVVEHGGEFHADARDGIGEQQRQNDARIARLAEPNQRGADDQQQAESGDPWLAAAGGIGNGAEHRRQQRDHEAGRQRWRTPTSPVPRGSAATILREIWREHKGRDQREIGLRGPVEEDPADDRGTARISRRSPVPTRSRRDHFMPTNFPQDREQAFCAGRVRVP